MDRYGLVIRIDWFRVIVDLGIHGWVPDRIAEHVGVRRSTVYLWKQGGEPRHCDGEKLLQLWRNQTGRDQAPRTGSIHA